MNAADERRPMTLEERMNSTDGYDRLLSNRYDSYEEDGWYTPSATVLSNAELFDDILVPVLPDAPRTPLTWKDGIRVLTEENREPYVDFVKDAASRPRIHLAPLSRVVLSDNPPVRSSIELFMTAREEIYEPLYNIRVTYETDNGSPLHSIAPGLDFPFFIIPIKSSLLFPHFGYPRLVFFAEPFGVFEKEFYTSRVTTRIKRGVRTHTLAVRFGFQDSPHFPSVSNPFLDC